MKKSGIKHEIWIDYVKTIACIFVVLGHLFQSLIKSNIIHENIFLSWFITTIYYFHVPLFFFSSGYLYQKTQKIANCAAYMKSVKKKLLNLIIPYVTFTILTLIIKMVFETSVNDAVKESILDTLILHPIPPYWFLYALFFIFLLIPTINSNKQMWCLSLIVLLLKIASITGVRFGFSAINYVMDYSIWFLGGMLVVYLDCKKILDRRWEKVFICFIPLSVIAEYYAITDILFRNIMTVLGMGLTLHLVYRYADRIMYSFNFINIISRHSMVIYLLHTICASWIRIVLLRLGIENEVSHVVFGMIFSFAFPIIVSLIAKRTVYLNFFFYPERTIRFLKKLVV